MYYVNVIILSHSYLLHYDLLNFKSTACQMSILRAMSGVTPLLTTAINTP